MTRYLLAAMTAAALCGCAATDDAASAPDPIPLGDPELTIGADDTRPGHELYRVSDVALLEDGRILIANAGTGEIRVFSPTGDLVGTISRSGGGPGENQFIFRIWAVRDTVVAFDPVMQKVLMWSVQGELIGEERLEGGPLDLRGRTSDGRFVNSYTESPPGIPVGTSRTDTASITLVGGAAAVELTSTPASTRFAATLPNGRTLYTPLPLEPQLSVAANGNEVFVGYGSDSTITRYSSDGQPSGFVRVPFRAEPLSPEIKAAWQETMLKRVGPEEQAEMQRYVDALPYPAQLPAFDRLFADDVRRLWVRQFVTPGSDTANWAVVEPGGTVVRIIRTPANLELRRVVNDRVIGMFRSEDEAERVSVWRITN